MMLSINILSMLCCLSYSALLLVSVPLIITIVRTIVMCSPWGQVIVHLVKHLHISVIFLLGSAHFIIHGTLYLLTMLIVYYCITLVIALLNLYWLSKIHLVFFHFLILRWGIVNRLDFTGILKLYRLHLVFIVILDS